MRLAVLSDIHGNLLALDAVLADLKAAGGADKTWVLGDLCGGGPRPAECLQRIRGILEVEVISGNTDRAIVTGRRRSVQIKDEAEWQKFPDTLRQREADYTWTVSRLGYTDYEYLSRLPPELSLNVPGYGWIIGYHGAPGDDERAMLPDTPDEEVLDQMLDREGRLGFGGHTHVQMDRDLGRWRVVNVGSIGVGADLRRADYALVTFEDGTATIDLRRVEYDVEAVARDMQQQEHPGTAQVIEQLKNAGN